MQEFADLDAGFRYRVTEPAGEGKRPPGVVGDEAGAAALFVPGRRFRSEGTGRRAFDDFKKQPLLPNQLSQLGGGIAWGDVDGDGDDDVFLGGASRAARGIALNEGKGGFEEQWVGVLQEDKECEDMGAVFFDADGDGDLDLFVASGSYEFDAGSEALSDRLYLNDGKGGFERAPADAVPPPAAAAGRWPRPISIGMAMSICLSAGASSRAAIRSARAARCLKILGGKFTDVSSEVPDSPRRAW